MKKTTLFGLVALLLAPWSLWSALNVLVLSMDGDDILMDETAKTQNDGLVVVSPQKHNNNRNDNSMGIPKKPTFILHVGPPKTGTTTIQWYAGEHMDTLQQDNIYYLGEYKSRTEVDVHHLCFACIMEKDECQDRWHELEGVLQRHFDQNHIVLMSDENFSRFGSKGIDEDKYLWNNLLPMLEKQQWNVRILFTYRRYYEWVPSWYYEYYNPNGARGKKKKRFLEWPLSKGRAIPSFASYFDAYVQTSYDMVSSVTKWRERFQDVRVLNMHNELDFVETFYCRLIPEATRLCKVIKKNQQEAKTTKNSSASKDLHYDMLATEANLRGWINSKKSKHQLDRTTVRKAIENHSKKLGYTLLKHFPLECLSKKQNSQLLDLSLKLESQLVPEFYDSAKGKTAIVKGFDNAVKTNKFCSIDLEAALKDKQFQVFLQSLN